MGQILVKRDPTLKQTNIIHSLISTTKEETPAEDTQQTVTGNMQTKVFGILCPLLAINMISIDLGDIDYFELDGTGQVPRCRFALYDRRNYFQTLNNPGRENELRVQILPPFDNAYKKVDLTFYIDSIKIVDSEIRGTGTYKVPKFTNSMFKCLGRKTTFELCDTISLETGIGLASNVDAVEDSRYMYLNHKSYKGLLSEEIRRSASDAEHVYDWWIDWWNYLVLCDVVDRVKNLDPDEDLKVWISDNRETSGYETVPDPVEIDCVLSNHPLNDRNELNVFDYQIVNKPENMVLQGNSNCISVYEENKKEYIDHLIQDSSIVRDEFVKYEYAGEVYGDYNYLLASRCRDFYLSKIQNEEIIVQMKYPMLGVMRGDQVKFVWFDNDSNNYFNWQNLQSTGILKQLDQYDLGWLKDLIIEDMSAEKPICPNLQVSGQYTVIGQKAVFDGDTQTWDYQLTLVRPEDRKPMFIEPELTEEEPQEDTTDAEAMGDSEMDQTTTLTEF